MAIIRILQYPDPRLKTKAKTVTNVNDPALQKIIDDMLETLQHTPNCGGLAATQLDIPNPPRITVIDIEDSGLMCLINPEVLETVDFELQTEACMSVQPDFIYSHLKRARKIKAKYLDRHGKVIEIEATGALAKCIQHEVDHLNGKLYIDHLSKLKRNIIDKKIEKISRWNTK